MTYKKLLFFVLFLSMVVAQWCVPLQMISEQEDIISTGKVFLFKTAPIDPYDAFRGKYIYLNYDHSELKVNTQLKFNYAEEVFVTLKDSAGYARIKSVSKTAPKKDYYVKASVAYFNAYKGVQTLGITYPFNRFYMNEYKAQAAENKYAKANQTQKNKCYAIVAVKNGKGVVKDVCINSISIKDLVKSKKTY